jgi:hypothetical protein
MHRIDSAVSKPPGRPQGETFIEQGRLHLGCVIQNLDPVVEMCRGKGQRLLKIRLFQVRIISEQLGSICIAAEYFEHPLHGDAKPADARLAAHLVGLDSNAVKWRPQRHETIVTVYVSFGTTARNNFINVSRTRAPASSTSSCTSFCGKIPAAALVTHEIANTFIPL